MRISEFGRQQAHPRSFWIAVLSAVLLLGGAGLYEVRTGRVPEFPSWLSALVVAFVWLSFMIGLVRYGRKSVAPAAGLFLLGYTLFVGSDLVLHAAHSASVIKDIGAVVLVVSGLLTFVSSAPPSSRPAEDTFQERQ